MKENEYQAMYDCEDHHFWYQSLRKLIGKALKSSGLRPACRGIDIGCGTGANRAMLKGFFPEGLMIGCDIHAKALHFSSLRNDSYLVQGDAGCLPFSANTFDLALAADVFSHQNAHDRAAMSECFRVLKPGGVLILNAAANEHLRGRHDESVQNLRRYCKSELTNRLESSGFVIDKMFYWNFLLLPFVFLFRKLYSPSPSRHSSQSDLRRTALDLPLKWILRLDLWIAWTGAFPTGTSLFALCRKPS